MLFGTTVRCRLRTVCPLELKDHLEAKMSGVHIQDFCTSFYLVFCLLFYYRKSLTEDLSVI